MRVFFIIFGTFFWVTNQGTRAVVASNSIQTSTKCEFYNQTMCANPNDPNCKDVEECEQPEDGKRSHCFVVWTEDENGVMNVSLKGCFLDNEDCYNKSDCVAKVSNPGKFLFCCCEGNMCNQNFKWLLTPTESPPLSSPIPAISPASLTILEVAIFIALFFVLFFILIICYIWYRKTKVFNELPTTDPSPLPPPSPYLDLRPIQLIEIKAKGRFGVVWKAKFKTEEIAVKVFPVQDKQSWVTEQEIFKLLNMNHPNILQYIGVEKHGDNLHSEFWLLTAFHESGSLCDFLKAHTLTWPELCKIAETMARGLMYLHEALPGKTPGEFIKPAVAHRDFKSKNVLLKSDLTACIADFGLAIVFEAGKACGDAHGQVGTRRYMAPEVLEGAINFTPDAFLRIDMYACGLVLWELVSRCTAQEGPIPEYRLPFEEEVGQHPTLEDMQEYVVQKKVRPTIQDHWKHHPGLAGICDTMEECWDHDAEARLSASCVMERAMQLSKFQPNSISWRIENDKNMTQVKEISM